MHKNDPLQEKKLYTVSMNVKVEAFLVLRNCFLYIKRKKWILKGFHHVL